MNIVGVEFIFFNYTMFNAVFCYLGIQELLTSPNPLSPAQREAYEAYEKNRKLYDQKVREQAARCAPDT